MIYRFVLWYLKRKLAKGGECVHERNIEMDIMKLMLNNIANTYHEDNSPAHVYVLTYFLAKVVRNHTGWKNNWLEIIKNGMNQEIETVFAHEKYCYVNAEKFQKKEAA